MGDLGSIPGSGKIPWRTEWLPTTVFLPGESHEQRNLVGYSPWGCKELDTTEQLTLLGSIITVYIVTEFPGPHFRSLDSESLGQD